MEAKAYDPEARHTFKLGRTEQRGRKDSSSKKKYILTEGIGFNIIDLIRQHRYHWDIKDIFLSVLGLCKDMLYMLFLNIFLRGLKTPFKKWLF